MAVEIVKSGNKEYLEVLYHFDDEKLTPFSPTLFHFAQSTKSSILFLKEKYTAINIHITRKLHEKSTNKKAYDMIIECQGTEQLTKKLFLCINIEFNDSGGTFMIQSPDFNTVLSKLSSTILYQTKTGNFVFVSNYTLFSASDAPSISISAKEAYKKVIEPDSFHESSTIGVAKTPLQKVITKTSYVGFKPFLNEMNEKEGFLSGTGSYMECKLLKENATDRNTVFEDVAIVPLKTNVYERGMVTFSHFLHFFLISFGAGLGFPNLLVTLFTHDDFMDDNTNKPNGLRMIIGFFSLIIFFLTGLILMIIGLADPKYTRKRKNHVGIKDGSVMATIGFYFVLVHCSFALGMFTFKKFEKLTDNGEKNKFSAMFDNEGLGASSFFDILDGLKHR